MDCLVTSLLAMTIAAACYALTARAAMGYNVGRIFDLS